MVFWVAGAVSEDVYNKMTTTERQQFLAYIKEFHLEITTEYSRQIRQMRASVVKAASADSQHTRNPEDLSLGGKASTH